MGVFGNVVERIRENPNIYQSELFFLDWLLMLRVGAVAFNNQKLIRYTSNIEDKLNSFEMPEILAALRAASYALQQFVDGEELVGDTLLQNIYRQVAGE